MYENIAGIGDTELVVCEPFSDNFWNKCIIWLEFQLQC